MGLVTYPKSLAKRSIQEFTKHKKSVLPNIVAIKKYVPVNSLSCQLRLNN